MNELKTRTVYVVMQDNGARKDRPVAVRNSMDDAARLVALHVIDEAKSELTMPGYNHLYIVKVTDAV